MAFGVPCLLYGALRRPLTDRPDAATAATPKATLDGPEAHGAPFAELKAHLRG